MLDRLEEGADLLLVVGNGAIPQRAGASSKKRSVYGGRGASVSLLR
jgi:hypothetical protein